MASFGWMKGRANSCHFWNRLWGDKFHRLTGKRLSVNLTIAKIAWLKAHKADVFAQTRKYPDVHAFGSRGK
jgi:sugar (pentulose or hexulose) kinase